MPERPVDEVRALLEARADPDVCDARQRTALAGGWRQLAGEGETA